MTSEHKKNNLIQEVGVFDDVWSLLSQRMCQMPITPLITMIDDI